MNIRLPRLLALLVGIVIGSLILIFGQCSFLKSIEDPISKTGRDKCSEQELLAVQKVKQVLFDELGKEKEITSQTELLRVVQDLGNFSYCENFLNLVLSKASHLKVDQLTNSERISVAFALQHTLENTEGISTATFEQKIAVITMTRDLMMAIKTDGVSKDQQETKVYKDLAISFSDLLEEMGFSEEADYWLAEHAKYKVMSKLILNLQKLDKSKTRFDNIVSNSAQKLQQRR